MRFFPAIMLFVTLCLISGCNSSRTIQVAIPQTPIAEDTATVVLFYQPTPTQNPLVTYEIFINDELVGDLLAEEPWQLELTPGKHTIEGRSTGLRSTVLSVNLKAGSINYFRVKQEYSTFLSDTIYVEPSPPITGYIMVSHR